MAKDDKHNPDQKAAETENENDLLGKSTKEHPARIAAPEKDKESVKAAPIIAEATPASPFDLISEEKKAEIRKAAKAQVEKEKRERAEELYMLQELSRARGDKTKIVDDWLDEVVNVTVALPALYSREPIIIDNIYYFDGFSYRVPRSRAMVINDVCDKCWKHEQQALFGKSENAYRKAKDARISAKTGIINTSDSFRVN